MTDNDDTPPIRQLTDEERMSHFDDFPPGTPPIENRMDTRLHRAERDVEGLRRDVASLVASRDTNRKIMWFVIPALVGALGTVVVYAAEKIASSSERVGETAAEIRALKEQRVQDREDIKELRERMLHMSGAEPHKPTSDQDLQEVPMSTPDKVATNQRPASGSGASTAASMSPPGGAGWIGWREQTPALQKLHCVGGCEQKALLSQSAKHSAFGPMPTVAASGGGGSGGGVQAAIAIATKMERIPWL